MKNYFFLCFIMISALSFSQEKECKQGISVMFIPQGYLDFNKTGDGLDFKPNLVFSSFFSKGKHTLLPIYTISNRVGIIYSHTLKESLSGYLVAHKSIIENGDYVGIGISKNVSGSNSLFIELGTSWDIKNPGVSIGMIFPLRFEFKKKN